MEFPFTGSRQALRIPALRRRFLAVLAGSLLVSWVTMAAVVSMHPPSGGGELRIPVMLYGDPDEYVSGLQFDLAYDPTQFELVGITAGDAATGAGKEVILSETTPGQGRVLITGFNNNGMSDGQVATLTLRPLNGSAPQHDISLGQVLASDPDGNSVPIDYADLYQYPPAPPIDEEVAPAPDETDAETVAETDDEATDENPDRENPKEVGAPDGGETTPESGGAGTSTTSGGFGNGFAGSGDGLNSTSDTEGSMARPAAPRMARSTPGSMPSERASGSISRPGRNDDTGYSASGVSRSINRGSQNTTATSTANLGAPTQRTEAIPEVGDSNASTEGTTSPTELALLRPASGLVDSPLSGSPSYTLAMDSADVKDREHGTRVIIAALTVSLTLTLLALANLIFGRVSRSPRRKLR